MKKVLSQITYSGNNYCACIPKINGVVATGHTIDEVKQNMKDALQFHIKGSMEDNDVIPDIFKGKYRLEFILKK